MRLPYLVHGLLAALLTLACGKDDGATDAATDGESDGGTTAPLTTTDPSGGSVSGGNACVPGMSVACVCPTGDMGAQVCAADGKSFNACECQGGSASASASDATSSPTEATSDPTNVSGDPTTTTGSESTSDGDSTTAGDSTTDGDSTTTGVNVCDDPGPEPNEDEASAVDLGDQSCAAPDGDIVGVLDGDADVDWWNFHGLDGQNCGFANPFIDLTLSAGDALRLCVFVNCDSGSNNEDFNCPMGTMDADSPEGLPGCCGAGNITFALNCSGTQNESAEIFIRVDQAAAGACVDYSVGYDWGPL